MKEKLIDLFTNCCLNPKERNLPKTDHSRDFLMYTISFSASPSVTITRSRREHIVRVPSIKQTTWWKWKPTYVIDQPAVDAKKAELGEESGAWQNHQYEERNYVEVHYYTYRYTISYSRECFDLTKEEFDGLCKVIDQANTEIAENALNNLVKKYEIK